MGFNIYELQKRFSTYKKFPYIIAVIRGVLMYLIFSFMVGITQVLFELSFEVNTQEYLTYPNVWKPLLQTLLTYLVLNTVILSFAVYHRSERLAFQAAHKTSGFDPAAERRELLSSSVFWTELATLAALFLLFPNHDAFIYPIRLIGLIPGLGHMHPMLKSILMLLFWSVGVLLLSVHSRIDARNLWSQRIGQFYHTKLWKSARIKELQSYSYFRFVLRLAGHLLLYVIGVYAFSYFLPLVISLSWLLSTLSVERWFWWLVGTLTALVLFLALRKRILLVHNIKKTCKKFGFRLFGARRLFLSLFFDGKGYTFGIKANGKTYYCRILASIKRSNVMVLDDKGFCTRTFALHIPSPLTAKAGPFVVMADRGNGDDRIFFHIDSKINYTFETDGDGEKILILNPVPKRAMLEIDGSRVEADNSDRVGDYQIFSGNAFLRYLMRESEAYDEKHT